MKPLDIAEYSTSYHRDGSITFHIEVSRVGVYKYFKGILYNHWADLCYKIVPKAWWSTERWNPGWLLTKPKYWKKHTFYHLDPTTHERDGNPGFKSRLGLAAHWDTSCYHLSEQARTPLYRLEVGAQFMDEHYPRKSDFDEPEPLTWAQYVQKRGGRCDQQP